MPAANTFPQRPQYGPFDDEPHDSWSMPVFRIGVTQIHVTYSVFVGLAVLTAFVASAAPREGNSDLPWVTLIGVAFWISGWMVQLIGALAMASWMRCTPASLTIGPWGVEAGAASVDGVTKSGNDRRCIDARVAACNMHTVG